MSPPAIGLVTNRGVGMGELDCCCCSRSVGPGRALAPPPPSTICSCCCTAVAAADVGCAAIGMKRLCLDPTVLGDCCIGDDAGLKMGPAPPVGVPDREVLLSDTSRLAASIFASSCSSLGGGCCCAAPDCPAEESGRGVWAAPAAAAAAIILVRM